MTDMTDPRAAAGATPMGQVYNMRTGTYSAAPSALEAMRSNMARYNAMYAPLTPEQQQRRQDAASAGLRSISSGYLYGVGNQTLADQRRSFYNDPNAVRSANGTIHEPGLSTNWYASRAGWGNQGSLTDAQVAQQWQDWANTQKQQFQTGQGTMSNLGGSTTPAATPTPAQAPGGYTGYGGISLTGPTPTTSTTSGGTTTTPPGAITTSTHPYNPSLAQSGGGVTGNYYAGTPVGGVMTNLNGVLK